MADPDSLPCEHCGASAPAFKRFCCDDCRDCEGKDHDATKADCAGICPAARREKMRKDPDHA